MRISRTGRPLLAGATGVAVLVSGLVGMPAAQADNSQIGLPDFHGSDEPVPQTDVGYDVDGQLEAIYQEDLAAGAGEAPGQDFWIDEMLAREGAEPGGEYGDANEWLFTRGRAVFMKTHEPGELGFVGEAAYWESLGTSSGAYAIDVDVDGAEVTLTEDVEQRRQTPSYWTSVFTSDEAGLRVDQTKLITDADVATTMLEVSSTDGDAKSVRLSASSELVGSADPETGELIGSVTAPNDITTVFPRLSGDGFVPQDGVLVSDLDVPAEGTVATKLQMGFLADERPDTSAGYDEVREATSQAAYSDHVRAYNEWWAQNVPYLQTPEPSIDKTLFYRWWLLRYNYLDADVPGNDYQFPTSMEGVLGYNNAIDLTIGMFVDDLKYLRDPVYSYGPWLSAGEMAGNAGQFRDNPGDPGHWGSSHTQYISEAAWRSYQLHGGPAPVVDRLGSYAERDTAGQLATWDSDGNMLLDTDWNAWTGNDADAVSFDYQPGRVDRAESAYVYSGAMAGAEALDLIGEADRAQSLRATADDVRTAVLDILWDSDSQLILHRNLDSGDLIPWKEINNYYPFAVSLVPKPGDEDYDEDYVEALRLFADAEEYPIFPFATANQVDRAEAAEAGFPGTNNFSIINSTVTFRMITSVLRDYPNDYVDADWYKKLLYWNAWAQYQENGDNRYPDANEFWADADAEAQSIDYRSWIHHTILGTTNFTMIEDAMGLRPRNDGMVELDPIDIGWDHFTANNIRYRDKDLTIVWDAPDGERHYGEDVPEGYSVFLDGELAFTLDGLGHAVYDPATGEVTTGDGVTVVGDVLTTDLAAPLDVTFADDERIVDVLGKAGVDTRTQSTEENLAAGAAADATFAAEGHDAAQATDGRTDMQSYWGTVGSENEEDSLTIDLGSTQTVDEARVYLYRTSSVSTDSGYAAPSQLLVEYHDGAEFVPVPDQARAPAYPRGNLNTVRFAPVETDALRITAQHAQGQRTGIKEVQAFETGLAAPDPVDPDPQARAWLDSSYDQPGSAQLIGEVSGGGISAEPVTAQWSVVSAPDGAEATFEQPTSPSSGVRFSDEGAYMLRLTATQGERSASTDVLVDASELNEGEINIAPAATPTAEFTASWNDVEAVNDERPPFFTGGDSGLIWGTWDEERPASRWLEYEWEHPVRVDSASIDFWSDTEVGGDGVAVPQGWQLQYRDGGEDGEWQDVSGVEDYPTEAGQTNEVSFDPVTTSRLRVVLDALPDEDGDAHSAVGVSEWRVYGAAPASVEDVDVRTMVGELPELPETVRVSYPDGVVLDIPVGWGEITEDDVAAVGDFTVAGSVLGTGLQPTAHIWVRAQGEVTINTVDPVEVTTMVDVPPPLPPTVTVQYNDGSRSSGIPVTWEEVDPSAYAQEGTFEVSGAVEGTDMPAEATVTVIESVPEDPTEEPTDDPTDEPTEEPTGEPDPIEEPTDDPSGEPTEDPSSDSGQTEEPTSGGPSGSSTDPTDGPVADDSDGDADGDLAASGAPVVSVVLLALLLTATGLVVRRRRAHA